MLAAAARVVVARRNWRRSSERCFFIGYGPGNAKSDENCTLLVTMASRSSVTATNHVLALAGGLGQVTARSVISAGMLCQVRLERRPVSVV